MRKLNRKIDITLTAKGEKASGKTRILNLVTEVLRACNLKVIEYGDKHKIVISGELFNGIEIQQVKR